MKMLQILEKIGLLSKAKILVLLRLTVSFGPQLLTKAF